MSAIPCLVWVKRGAAKHKPDRLSLLDNEMNDLIGENMEEDESNSEDEENTGEGPSSGFGLGGLKAYNRTFVDPYMPNTGVMYDSEEEEDLLINNKDNLIVSCKVEPGMCNLEVHLYNKEEGSFYVHHDIMLPDYPVVFEWLDFDPADGAMGNFVAMGFMEPTIKIWDIDIMDAVDADFTLPHTTEDTKNTTNLEGHSDAVLGLSWNKLQRNILASGSADFTVGLWDLNELKLVSTIKEHREKVQCVNWHPVEEQTLLTGGFDKTVKTFDCRNSSSYKSWDMPAVVENVCWNPYNPYCFLAGLENGYIHCIDVRHSKPVYELKAHTSEVTGVNFSCSQKNCLYTSSTDGFFKVWDVTGTCPVRIAKKSLTIGEIQSSMACPDEAFIVAVGGEHELKILNLAKNANVNKHYNLAVMPNYTKEEDSSDSEEELSLSDNSDDEENLVLHGTSKAPKERREERLKMEGQTRKRDHKGNKSKKK